MADPKGKSVGQLGKTSSTAINRTNVSSQLRAFTGKKKTQEELELLLKQPALQRFLRIRRLLTSSTQRIGKKRKRKRNSLRLTSSWRQPSNGR